MSTAVKVAFAFIGLGATAMLARSMGYSGAPADLSTVQNETQVTTTVGENASSTPMASTQPFSHANQTLEAPRGDFSTVAQTQASPNGPQAESLRTSTPFWDVRDVDITHIHSNISSTERRDIDQFTYNYTQKVNSSFYPIGSPSELSPAETIVECISATLKAFPPPQSESKNTAQENKVHEEATPSPLPSETGSNDTSPLPSLSVPPIRYPNQTQAETTDNFSGIAQLQDSQEGPVYNPTCAANHTASANSSTPEAGVLPKSDTPPSPSPVEGSAGEGPAAHPTTTDKTDSYFAAAFSAFSSFDLPGMGFLTAAVAGIGYGIKSLAGRGTALSLNVQEQEKAKFPLHEAVIQKNHPLLQQLINSGQNLNQANENGRTALHEACSRENEAAAQLLIEHDANINAKNKEDRTPLHLAVSSNRPEIVKLLLDNGANVDAQDKEGRTPLHEALSQYISNRQEIVELLLNKGANVNAQDREGKTPLHPAVQSKDETIVKLLVIQGANIDAKAKDGSTPWSMAQAMSVRGQHNSVLEALRTSKPSNVTVDKQAAREQKTHSAPPPPASSSPSSSSDSESSDEAQKGKRRDKRSAAAESSIAAPSSRPAVSTDTPPHSKLTDAEMAIFTHMREKYHIADDKANGYKLFTDFLKDNAGAYARLKRDEKLVALLKAAGIEVVATADEDLETKEMPLPIAAPASTSSPLSASSETSSARQQPPPPTPATATSAQESIEGSALASSSSSSSSDSESSTEGSDKSTLKPIFNHPNINNFLSLKLTAEERSHFRWESENLTEESETAVFKRMIAVGDTLGANINFTTAEEPLETKDEVSPRAAPSSTSSSLSTSSETSSEEEQETPQTTSSSSSSEEAGESEQVESAQENLTSTGLQPPPSTLATTTTSAQDSPQAQAFQNLKAHLEEMSKLKTSYFEIEIVDFDSIEELQDKECPLHAVLTAMGNNSWNKEFYESAKTLLGLFIEAGADLTQVDDQGRTVVHLLMKQPLFFEGYDNHTGSPTTDGLIKFIDALFQNNDLIDKKDRNDRTPLHEACLAKNPEIVKLLLEKGADVKAEDKNGRTPLHEACSTGNLDVVKLLLQNSADINIQDKNGRTMLHDAIVRNHPEVVEMLLSAGNPPRVDTFDAFGRSPLSSAISQGLKIDIIQKLINPDFINAPDREGYTPLHHAIARITETDNKDDLITTLLGAGADPGLLPVSTYQRPEKRFQIPASSGQMATQPKPPKIPFNPLSPIEFIRTLSSKLETANPKTYANLQPVQQPEVNQKTNEDLPPTQQPEVDQKTDENLQPEQQPKVNPKTYANLQSAQKLMIAKLEEKVEQEQMHRLALSQTLPEKPVRPGVGESPAPAQEIDLSASLSGSAISRDLLSSFVMVDEDHAPVHFESDCRQIIAFADKSDTAEIIYNTETGLAVQANLLDKLVRTSKNTPPPVEILQKAVDHAITVLETYPKRLNQVPPDATKETKKQLLNEYNGALRLLMNLNAGLQRIAEVYNTRSQTESSIKKSSEQLVDYAKGAAERLDQALKDYQGVISQYLSTSDLSTSFVQPMADTDLKHKELKTRLDAYCKFESPGLTREKADELIKQGKKLCTQVLTSTESVTLSQAPAQAQEQIAALTWYFMRLAITKEQGFDEGTFVIKDPDQKLYNFLKSAPQSLIGERYSSHFRGRSTAEHFLGSIHQGIDITNALMPGGKRTIDFDMVRCFNSDKKVLYFKPENYGTFLTTGWGLDTAAHGYEFLQAQYVKRFVPDGDDQSSMQKERVPTELTKGFASLVKQLKEKAPKGSELAKEFETAGLSLEAAEKEAKKWGVAYIQHFLDGLKGLKELKDEFNAENNGQIEELAAHVQAAIEKVTAGDSDEARRLRTGREVILTVDELMGKRKERLQQEVPEELSEARIISSGSPSDSPPDSGDDLEELFGTSAEGYVISETTTAAKPEVDLSAARIFSLGAESGSGPGRSQVELGDSGVFNYTAEVAVPISLVGIPNNGINACYRNASNQLLRAIPVIREAVKAPLAEGIEAREEKEAVRKALAALFNALENEQPTEAELERCDKNLRDAIFTLAATIEGYGDFILDQKDDQHDAADYLRMVLGAVLGLQSEYVTTVTDVHQLENGSTRVQREGEDKQFSPVLIMHKPSQGTADVQKLTTQFFEVELIEDKDSLKNLTGVTAIERQTKLAGSPPPFLVMQFLRTNFDPDLVAQRNLRLEQRLLGTSNTEEERKSILAAKQNDPVEVTTRLQFPEDDIIEFAGERYRLVGTVQHEGADANSGHYTAHIKQGGQWYHFNDNKVEKEPGEIAKEQAYMAFFTKV